MPNRAVTIKCVKCGLEVTGVRQPGGIIRPSNTSRPELGAPVEPGLCIPCSKGQKIERL